MLSHQPSIVVRVKGGLGNQLFQYALGRHLALRCGGRLVVDLTKLYDLSKSVRRRYQLGVFRPPLEYTLLSRINKAVRLPVVYDALAQLTTWAKNAVKWQRHYRERSLRFDETVFRLSGDVYLDGYWQSEKYFANIADIIREDLLFVPPSPTVTEFGLHVRSSPAVGIHVRRTDYVSGKSATGFVGLEYYNTALRTLSCAAESLGPYLVFSEDIEWCREHLASLLAKDCIYVDGLRNESGAAISDFWLLSQCKYFVIPNSTYSWWAAWLSTRPDKVVLAPKRWFRNSAWDDQDILPSGWLRV